MYGFKIKREGDELVLRIDVSAKAMAACPPSKSGKTRLLATTAGNKMYEKVILGLNCYYTPRPV